MGIQQHREVSQFTFTAPLSHDRALKPIASDPLAPTAIFCGFHVLCVLGLELASVQYASSPRLRIALHKPAVNIKAANNRLQSLCTCLSYPGLLRLGRTFRGSDLRCQSADVLDWQEIDQTLSPDKCVLINKSMYPCLFQGRQRGWSPRDSTPVPVVPEVLLGRSSHIVDKKLLLIIRKCVSTLEIFRWRRLLLDLLRLHRRWRAAAGVRHRARDTCCKLEQEQSVSAV